MAAIGACGGGTPGRATDFSFPTFALTDWHTFPADAVPRVIVRLHGLTPDKPGVFTSTAAQTAFYCNLFTVRAGSLPLDLPAEAHARWASGLTITYPAVSAVDAEVALASQPNPLLSRDCMNVAPVALTQARLGSAQFTTDRGRAEMTAWFFTMSGSTGELPFPAIAPSAFWRGPAGIVSGGGDGYVSEDGMSLSWVFAGAPVDGRCGTGYTSTVAETTTAIAIKVQATTKTPDDCIFNFFDEALRTVSIALTAPLGGRVVVDDEGKPGEICKTSQGAAGFPC
ncbi:MAG: hypothetical protein ABI334_10020 [Candidatus Dormiibacterota bacterium]